MIEAGDWASTVPDRLSAWGRYGVRIDETLEEAIAAFEDAVADGMRERPVAARASSPGDAGLADGSHLASCRRGHELRSTSPAAAVADVHRRAAAATFGGPYGSDLRHYATCRHRHAAVRPGRRPLRARDRRARRDSMRCSPALGSTRCWRCVPAGSLQPAADATRASGRATHASAAIPSPATTATAYAA